MYKFSRILGLVIMAFALVVIPGVAQEDADDMSETEPATDATLDDIAANSPDYWGTRVTVDGSITTFLNAKIFVLGEDALIDNDQVLVVNMTDTSFDMNITNEQEVRVSGTILPSLEERDNDGLEMGEFWTSDDEMTEEEEAMNDVEMNMMLDPLQFIYDGDLSDDYDVYTVLVIDDITTVSVISEEETDE